MKKTLLITSLLVTGLIMLAPDAKAGNPATINVTVTIPSVISVSVDPTSWAIGSVTLGQTVTTAVDNFSCTNDGNVAEDFAIVSGNSANWACGAAAGSEIFSMEAQGGDIGSWTSIDTSQPLKSNIAKDGTVDFGLQFTAPTATTSTDIQQTINTTVTASKH